LDDWKKQNEELEDVYDYLGEKQQNKYKYVKD